MKPEIPAVVNVPAKGFSTNNESSSLGGEEFGAAESFAYMGQQLVCGEELVNRTRMTRKIADHRG